MKSETPSRSALATICLSPSAVKSMVERLASCDFTQLISSRPVISGIRKSVSTQSKPRVPSSSIILIALGALFVACTVIFCRLNSICSDLSVNGSSSTISKRIESLSIGIIYTQSLRNEWTRKSGGDYDCCLSF